MQVRPFDEAQGRPEALEGRLKPDPTYLRFGVPDRCIDGENALVLAAGVRGVPSHSARSAITGSIRVARRAGNHDAHSVTNSRKTDSAR